MRSLAVASLAVPAIVALLFIRLAGPLGVGRPWIAPVAVLLCTSLTFVGLKAFRGVLHRKTFGNGGALSVPTRYALRENGIEAERSYGNALTYWDGIFDVTRDRSHLFVFLDARIVTIIPDRSFPTPADAIAFSDEVKARWTKARAGGAP